MFTRPPSLLTGHFYSPALGVSVPVTLSLREPLGTRSVIDNTGRAIPDLGTYRAVPVPSP